MTNQGYEIKQDEEYSPVRKLPQLGVVAEPDMNLPKEILLIEDDEEFAQMAALAIESNSNSKVTIAHDPFQAEQIMLEKAFDLVLTDWNLPILNGFNTLRRANEHLDEEMFAPESWFERRTPVIVITVSDRSVIESERKPRGRFQYIGVVSKGQPIEGILQEMSRIYTEKAGGVLLRTEKFPHNENPAGSNKKKEHVR